MSKKKTAGDIAKTAALVLSPTGYGIYKILEHALSETENAAESQDIERLRAVEMRQEFEMRMAERHARVAQELAIAERIANAAEVEIEEFYDLKGDAKLGVDVTAETISAGLSGSGSRVTRRVFRFKADPTEK